MSNIYFLEDYSRAGMSHPSVVAATATSRGFCETSRLDPWLPVAVPDTLARRRPPPRGVVAVAQPGRGRRLGTVTAAVGPKRVDLSRARSEARRVLRTMGVVAAGGAYLGTVARSVRRTEALIRRNLELERHSRVDDLTGVFNRRHIDERLRIEFDAACRRREALSVLMLDIDDFKLVNDGHGHLAGDMALREVTRRLVGALWPQAIVGRWGGEEFLIISPRTGPRAAIVLAEQIRRIVAESPVAIGGAAVDLTVSCGCATLPAGHPEDLVRRADAGLYRAKRTGRNRVAGC